MTRASRQQAIVQLLLAGDELSVAELAERFGVNRVTIRRDLAELERQGLVRRTHGGALASRGGRAEFALGKRQQAHLAEKRAIADAVARLIQPGMAVCLDTGTTTLAVAGNLPAIGPLKVLTSSLAIAAALYPHDSVELVLLGGQVRRAGSDLFGPLTEENLRRFRVNLAVLGADAVSPDGLFTTDVNTARVSQAMLAVGQTRVLAIDSSKFEATAFVRFGSWPDIDHVVTDEHVPASTRQWLEPLARKVTYVCVG